MQPRLLSSFQAILYAMSGGTAAKTWTRIGQNTVLQAVHQQQYYTGRLNLKVGTGHDTVFGSPSGTKDGIVGQYKGSAL